MATESARSWAEQCAAEFEAEMSRLGRHRRNGPKWASRLLDRWGANGERAVKMLQQRRAYAILSEFCESWIDRPQGGATC